jgi:hypothetical protein
LAKQVKSGCGLALLPAWPPMLLTKPAVFPGNTSMAQRRR